MPRQYLWGGALVLVPVLIKMRYAIIHQEKASSDDEPIRQAQVDRL